MFGEAAAQLIQQKSVLKQNERLTEVMGDKKMIEMDNMKAMQIQHH